MRGEPEIWKPVSGYDGYYEVSSLGRVRSVYRSKGTHPGRIKTNQLTEDGYLRVKLSKQKVEKSFFVSRLVCESFHGPPPSPTHEADHRNRKRNDARASNLRWRTREENFADAVHAFGEDHPRAVLTDEIVREMRATPHRPGLYQEIARTRDLHVVTVRNAYQGKTWKHLGPGNPTAPADGRYQKRAGMEFVPRGEKHTKAVLTEEQVRFIRSLPKPARKGQIERIAKEWGIKPKTLRDVRSGHNWKHVE